jgi:SAM-dependent methyltransferase
VAPGPGVDRVSPGQELDEPDASFDVVISCECFEHNPFWRETFTNMIRMLKPGGLCVITAAMIGRQEHGTTRMNPNATLADGDAYVDYYRNLFPGDLLHTVHAEREFAAWVNHPNIYRKDLYFVALKRGAGNDDLSKFSELERSVRDIRVEHTPGPLGRLRYRLDYGFKRLLVAGMGEDRFHDAKFAARQLTRRMLEVLVGRERVQRFRNQRRQLKELQRGRLAPPGNDSESTS